MPASWLLTEAAPIVKYMLDWTGAEVAAYCAKKDWTWKRWLQDYEPLSDDYCADLVRDSHAPALPGVPPALDVATPHP